MIYEVNLEVQTEIAVDFRAWLDLHIQEILTLPGFVAANWFELNEEMTAERSLYVVHYHVDSTRNLDAYLADSAEKYRADGLAKFGDKFSAKRRILKPLKVYGR